MAIIVCPKCAKKHKVNLDIVKKNVPLGKKIAARCKSCGHKFPVQLDKLIPQKKNNSGNRKQVSEKSVLL